MQCLQRRLIAPAEPHRTHPRVTRGHGARLGSLGPRSLLCFGQSQIARRPVDEDPICVPRDRDGCRFDCNTPDPCKRIFELSKNAKELALIKAKLLTEGFCNPGRVNKIGRFNEP